MGPEHISGWEACLADTLVEEEELCAPAVEADDGGKLREMMAAVSVLLHGLGEEPGRDGLVKTPLRVARALMSATRGYRQSAQHIIGDALFSEAGAGAGAGCGGGSGGMVVVRNVDLFASCEACLLPFRVRCHMAYVPSGERVVGLSKLPRVAEMYAKRLQSPERFADEVVQALADVLKPFGVAIVVECWHLQWPTAVNNGVMDSLSADRMVWVPSTVHAARGQLQVGGHLWDEFVAMLDVELGVSCGRKCCPFSPRLGDHGVARGLADAGLGSILHGEPFLLTNGCGQRLCGLSAPLGWAQKPALPSFSEMVAAVETLLLAVGEDPRRDGLRFTPERFVRNLLASTQGNFASLGLNGSINGGVNGYSNGCHSTELVAGLMVVDGATGSFSLQQDLCFLSQCEHHLLPFAGIVHIGYFVVQGARHINRSALQKMVTVYSQRLQVQERLTRQIAEAVAGCSGVHGVMVKVEANHMCMVSRGIEKIGSTTATVATLGSFVQDSAARLAFLRQVKRSARGKE